VSAPVIRYMLLDDVPAVSAIDRLCFTVPWSPPTFTAELSNPVGYYRVAIVDETVVGYIGSHLILDEAHVTTFGVHPDTRRQRVGERLLADMLQASLRSGCRRVTLEVRETNEAAQRLYAKYGFAPVSRRHKYYPDTDEDAIVMWIEDTSRLGFRTLFEDRLNHLNADEPSGQG
jgi:ribosomal-protein-alanine N-acetyltransferase